MTEEIKILNRDQILGAEDFEKELVKVPEWGGSVYVRVMRGVERDKFEEKCLDEAHFHDNMRATLCSMTLCDENGNLLFTKADIPELGKKSGKALDRAFEVAKRINKISKEDIEDLEKNSGEGQEDSSSSD